MFFTLHFDVKNLEKKDFKSSVVKPDTLWIRIRIELKFLTHIRIEVNPDPQPCLQP
jgi:hypothetical protein